MKKRKQNHYIVWNRSFLFALILILLTRLITGNFATILSINTLITFVILVVIAYAGQKIYERFKKPQTTKKVSKKEFSSKRSRFFKQRKVVISFFAVGALTIIGLLLVIIWKIQFGIVLVLVGALIMNIIRRQFTDYMYK